MTSAENAKPGDAPEQTPVRTYDQSDGMTHNRPGKIPADDAPAPVVPKDQLRDAPHDDEALDEALEDSMDGSDPPAATQP